MPAQQPVPPLLAEAMWARANGGRATALTPISPISMAQFAGCVALEDWKDTTPGDAQRVDGLPGLHARDSRPRIPRWAANARCRPEVSVPRGPRTVLYHGVADAIVDARERSSTRSPRAGSSGSASARRRRGGARILRQAGRSPDAARSRHDCAASSAIEELYRSVVLSPEGRPRCATASSPGCARTTPSTMPAYREALAAPLGVVPRPGDRPPCDS